MTTKQTCEQKYGDLLQQEQHHRVVSPSGSAPASGKFALHGLVTGSSSGKSPEVPVVATP